MRRILTGSGVQCSAVGGRAFYHPGDEKTVVDLGCTYPELLNGACKGPEDTIAVSAYVSDFDTQVSVSKDTADRLLVALGSPIFNPLTGGYDILPGETVTPTRLPGVDPASWQITVPTSAFEHTLCLQALEVVPQATNAVTCMELLSSPTIDITGYRLSRFTLSQILTALGRTTFPDQGLVVGILLDPFLRPVADQTVFVDSGTVKYLSADRSALTTGKTSSNGIFVSEDAPYFSQFSWNGQVTALGGLLDGKVTIVVLKQPMMSN